MNEDMITATEDVTEDTFTEVAPPPSEEETVDMTNLSSEEEEGKTEVSEITDTPASEEEESETALLRRELDSLRRELEEKRNAFERMSRDIGEFSELFPEKNINSIPDSVWESVKSGIPLAAAYALYERKNTIRQDMARRANEENSVRATGSIGRDSTENFFTPDEVRAMSRAEIKSNYSKIIESMKKWN